MGSDGVCVCVWGGGGVRRRGCRSILVYATVSVTASIAVLTVVAVSSELY